MSEHDATGRRSIAVIGAGYVGLVSAVGLAARATASSWSRPTLHRLAALREGRVPFTEKGRPGGARRGPGVAAT